MEKSESAMKEKIKKRLSEQEIFSSKEMVCVISFMLCLIIIILCYYDDAMEQQQIYQYQSVQKNSSSELIFKKTGNELRLLSPEVFKLNEAKQLIEFFQNLKVTIKWAPVTTESFPQTSEFIDYLTDHGYSFCLLEKNGISGPEFNKDQLLNIKSEIDLVLMQKNKYSEAEIGYQSLLK